MQRRWRTMIPLLALALIVTGPAALAASDGNGDLVTDNAQDRTSDRVQDRVTDRVQDRETDRVQDREADQVRDHVVDRPQCDRDPEADRPADCRTDRPTDHLRPWLERCINWVTEHTDIRTNDSLRFWWHLCHRLAWNHAHPV